MIQPAGHKCSAGCLLRAERPRIRFSNTRGTHVELVAWGISEHCQGLETCILATRYSTVHLATGYVVTLTLRTFCQQETA